MIKIAIITLALLFFSHCEKSDSYDDATPTDADKELYQATVDHLLRGHLDGPYVVTRKPDGSPAHMGEGLIWSGTFLYAAPCEKGRAVSVGLADMVRRNVGGLLRYEPLGEYANGRQSTLDGALGLFLGIARRVVNCGELNLWAEPLKLMVDFQKANDGRLHPGTLNRIQAEFDYLRDLLAHRARQVGEPSTDRRDRLLAQVAGWSQAVRTAHVTGIGADGCFRVNLGMTTLLALETLSVDVRGQSSDIFCQATKDSGIPLVLHWCGWREIGPYIETYDPTLYEYRHQRCGYESQDGNGNTSHRLDLLMALVEKYGFESLNQ